jgi:hypothetical protein
MSKTPTDFENSDVTITMKGAEWFALVAKAAGKSLSPQGRVIANSAGQKLCDQLSAASNKIGAGT